MRQPATAMITHAVTMAVDVSVGLGRYGAGNFNFSLGVSFG
jgi:hypothetical protein